MSILSEILSRFLIFFLTCGHCHNSAIGDALSLDWSHVQSLCVVTISVLEDTPFLCFPKSTSDVWFRMDLREDIKSIAHCHQLLLVQMDKHLIHSHWCKVRYHRTLPIILPQHGSTGPELLSSNSSPTFAYSCHVDHDSVFLLVLFAWGTNGGSNLWPISLHWIAPETYSPPRAMQHRTAVGPMLLWSASYWLWLIRDSRYHV